MPEAPNIIMILCDDLGWMDLGVQGSSFYETPNLDRLASEGIRFTEAYASCPVCSPTRASLMTGKYPASVGITQYIGGHNVGALCDVPYFHRLPKQEIALPRVLKERGNYQTWHVGKWHLGDGDSLPESIGFEVNIGGCHWGHPNHGYFSPWNIPGLPDAEEGTYLTDYLNDEAVRLIQQRKPEVPFYLNYWPYAVHTPTQAPVDLIEKYEKKAESMGLAEVDPFEEGEEIPVMGNSLHVRRRTIQSDPAYAAMIENLDTNLGNLFDTLDSEGLRENTWVFFTSDNGGLATAEGSPTCNAPLCEGKELYNLARDIGENTNLAEEEPERRDALHKKLRLWRTKVCAQIPQPNPHWPVEPV